MKTCCEKCNGSDIYIRYIRDKFDCDYSRKHMRTRPCANIEDEHLEYTCRTCKFEWSGQVASNVDDERYLLLKGAHERLCEVDRHVTPEWNKFILATATECVEWLMDYYRGNNE